MGRLVGPVEVLDQQEQGRAPGQPPEQAKQQLEHARLVGLAKRADRGLAEPWLQSGQLPPRGADQRPHGIGAQLIDQQPEHLDDRCVGQAAPADRDAAAPERASAGMDAPPGHLGEQPGLAQPGLARDQDDRGSVGGGP